MIFGRRTIWPNADGVLHWEIRKAFTIPGYRSETFERIKLSGDETDAFTRYDMVYRTSCLDLVETRIGFYEYSMPAANYRRTSLDFHMERVEDPRIDAYVDQSAPDTIVLQDGILLALEDGAHSIFGTWPQPFELDFGDPDPQPLRIIRPNNQQFARYDLTNTSGPWEGTIPRCVANAFMLVSADASRQLFADHLSTMALLWVIAHEDAHTYSGHLRSFARTAIAGQERLFDELVAQHRDPDEIAHRRAAELEADTNATMRAVDYCFDSEFLAIATDWVSPIVRHTIRQGRRESDELTEEQRAFLLRLIAAGAILPLIIFETASDTEPSANKFCYPSFVVRAMNVAFTVVSRAVDVSFNQPQQNVGSFSLIELRGALARILVDVARLHAVFRRLTGREPDDDVSCLPHLIDPFFDAFLGYHGQAKVLHADGRVTLDDLATDGDLVETFVRERHAMDLTSLEVFADAKAMVNQRRIDKVRDDLGLLEARVRRAREVFPFLP